MMVCEAGAQKNASRWWSSASCLPGSMNPVELAAVAYTAKEASQHWQGVSTQRHAFELKALLL
jgi:hypothetical protein